MAIELGITLMKDIFTNTTIFNLTWIFSIVLTYITLFLLTRDYKKWKALAFPVMIGWHIAGITPFTPVYIAAAIIFAIEELSIEQMGSLLRVIANSRTGRLTEESVKKGAVKLYKLQKKGIKKGFEKRKIKKEEKIKKAVAGILFKQAAKEQRTGTKNEAAIPIKRREFKTIPKITTKETTIKRKNAFPIKKGGKLTQGDYRKIVEYMQGKRKEKLRKRIKE